MSKIALLTQETIDKIAAGEVVERPSSVVKELVENAIDAKATAITIEIKEGGISFIRISDNGCGIEKSEVPLAFLRHSTSKIRSVEDLLSVSSLGFRGEALSSIAAVSRVELITKTPDSLTGVRYQIEGSKEVAFEEIGAPDGTTFLVKDLFYNTPARKKFLKSAQTEGSYIADMVEKLALSHPDISFKFIQNNQTKLHTSGNGNIKDLIYHVFGREISNSVLPVELENELFSVTGYIGKPVITRGNRNFEIYFINGRYVKSQLLSKAIEEAYKSFLMQHQYPFCVLYFTFQGESLDVNVHPTKMELRFDNNQEIYQYLCDGLYEVLSHKEMIPEVPVAEEKKAPVLVREYKESIPEPFEARRLNQIRSQEAIFPAGQLDRVRESVKKDSPYEIKYPLQEKMKQTQVAEKSAYHVDADAVKYENITLESISSDFLTKDAKKKHRIIGQLFKTYWLVEFEDKLFIVDQHAAHEKVLYERTMATLKEKEYTSQTISPPIILSLDANEILMLEKYKDSIAKMGYEVESFGGKEYMISAIPANLFKVDMKDLFIEMLDDFTNLSGRETPELILEKVASMSCKAAVKGNQNLSFSEFDALIEELLTLDNPYNCPHGRPTIISMTKYEIEKKFKRII
ncbi:MAG: DNA mismatch repair endonuclease MutL [Agathobacter sp.]|nr:DNA mismatch repair endonuclease MutL [Agathobacter sp.]